MKNSLQKGTLGLLVVLIVLTLVGAINIAAATPGTRTAGPAQLTTIIPDPLTVQVTETGKISLSTDGMGVNTGAVDDHGTIRVDKPSVGATVRKAYLMSATTPSGYALASGDVLLDGANVWPWDLQAVGSFGTNNYWKDVTSIVKPVVDAAPAGIVNFDIDESNSQTGNIDGEALAVIFDDPAQTTDNTVVLLFGAQSTTGDNFNVALGKPADFTDPKFGIGFGLGISFGYQNSQFNTGQFSTITVNGNTLSSSAGGQDDAQGFANLDNAGNGALMTVGGIGDLPNPLLPMGCSLGARCDTERYMLSPPFVNNGDTAIKVDTVNPSTDDDIFFAWFDVTSSTAIVGEGILLSPTSATNPVGSTHTVTAKVQDNNGNPIMGKVVTFTVVSGPNAGQTGTGTTDASGLATFTYTSNGNAGTDVIEASFVDSQGKTITSNQVTKEWIAAPTKGSISGMKFNDLNGDGTRQAGEPGLNGWNITLTNDTGVTITQTTAPAPDGSYNFTNLTDGNYTVGEVIQPGWIQTAPAISATGSATYKVQISGGNAVTGKDFGNFQLGSVSGMKFEDLNANGIRDAGEVGLAGWNITINGTDTITGTIVNETTTTDANGNYNFTGLTAGTYTISETMQNGWVQTAPATGTYTITITSGAAITGQDFGNFHKGKITGGGWISIPKGDTKATFGLVGQYPDSSNTAQGNVEYQDHVAKLNIKSTAINSVATTLDKKKGVITGIAQVNGAGSYPFTVYVEDNGEPGKGVDVFEITLPTYPYSSGAPLVLSSGNIQIHS